MHQRHKFLTILPLSFAAVFMSTFPDRLAAQERLKLDSDYVVSLYGLTIARSHFTSHISSDAFSMTGTIESAGLAAIFDDTKGTTVVAGRFREGKTLPDSYSVAYTTGKKAKKTSLEFAKGRVSSVSNTPRLKKRGTNWVALSDKDLSGVTDPISAVLVRASGLGAVCNRTIQVFDGEFRGDLQLRHLSIGRVDFGAYKGDVAFCRGKFVPVAGYRPTNKSVKYLRDRSDIRLTFAPLGKTGVYAPVRATIGTQIGTVTVSARRIDIRE